MDGEFLAIIKRTHGAILAVRVDGTILRFERDGRLSASPLRDTLHILGAFMDNPHAAYDAFLREFAWTIFVIAYVGGVDGALKAPERTLIAEFCQRRGNLSELQLDRLETLVKDLGKADKSTFHKYIRERTAPDEVIRDLMATAQAIVALNRRPHTEQERAISYMQDKWKAILSA